MEWPNSSSITSDGGSGSSNGSGNGSSIASPVLDINDHTGQSKQPQPAPHAPAAHSPVGTSSYISSSSSSRSLPEGLQLLMPDPQANSANQVISMHAQLIRLLRSLKPMLPHEQYLSLGLQMQQCFQQQRQALFAEKLLIKFFDVHMAVLRRDPLDAVVRSLQCLLKSPGSS
jgi:hypothetical protein